MSVSDKLYCKGIGLHRVSQKLHYYFTIAIDAAVRAKENYHQQIKSYHFTRS